MKKSYLSPKLTIAKLQMSACLLTASGGSKGDTTWDGAFGDDATDGEVGNSRRRNVWEDEEDF